MKHIVLMASFLVLSGAGFSSDNEDQINNSFFMYDFLNQDLIVNFASMLDDRTIGNLAKTNKRNKDLLSQSNLAGGKLLRSQSKFGVIDKYGKIYFLEEYLTQGGRIRITSVNNVYKLFKQRPDDFIKLVMKAIPYQGEDLESDLKEFYSKTMQIDDLIEHLLKFKTSKEKLKAFMLDYMIWSPVGNPIWQRIREQTSDPIGVQIYAQFSDKIGLRIWGEIKHHVRADVVSQLHTQIRSYIWRHHNNNQIWSQVRNDWSNFLLSIIQEKMEFKESLSLAIDYCSMVYQLVNFAIAYKIDFNTLMREQDDRSLEFYFDEMSEEKARDILENIELPQAPGNNILLQNVLKILQRHLP